MNRYEFILMVVIGAATLISVWDFVTMPKLDDHGKKDLYDFLQKGIDR